MFPQPVLNSLTKVRKFCKRSNMIKLVSTFLVGLVGWWMCGWLEELKLRITSASTGVKISVGTELGKFFKGVGGGSLSG